MVLLLTNNLLPSQPTYSCPCTQELYLSFLATYPFSFPVQSSLNELEPSVLCTTGLQPLGLAYTEPFMPTCTCALFTCRCNLLYTCILCFLFKILGYTYTLGYTCTCTLGYTNTFRVYVHIRVCIPIRVYMYVRVYIRIRVYIHIRVYVHVRDTCLHVWMVIFMGAKFREKSK